MQPIGKLDDEHAYVLGHGHDHLAHRLGLGAVAVLDLIELRDAVDQHADFVSEIGSHFVERVLGIFDSVVQQRCGNGLRPDAKVCQDLGHRYWVRDVWLTTSPHLTFVCALSGRVGTFDDSEIHLGVMNPDGLNQGVDRPSRLSPRKNARHEATQ